MNVRAIWMVVGALLLLPMAAAEEAPKVQNDERGIEKWYWKSEESSPKRVGVGGQVEEKARGRESYGPPYYPSAGYELRDGAGKLWWNADVDSWYGGNPARFNQSSSMMPGVVFSFLARTYPESERREEGGKRGWGVK